MLLLVAGPARHGRGHNTARWPEAAAPRLHQPRRWSPHNAPISSSAATLVLFNPNDCAEDTTLRNMDGSGAYRFAGPRGSETLDIMQKKYPNWFSPNLHQFWGQRERLPFDQHWFLALAAPRPFIALEGDTDTISLPEAVRQSMLGARPAYTLSAQRIAWA